VVIEPVTCRRAVLAWSPGRNYRHEVSVRAAR
jgi:hypothetical protein